MSLNLSQLLPQIERLGETVTKQRKVQQEALPKLSAALERASEMGMESLQDKVRKAGDRWPGAAPSTELPNAVFPPPSLPEEYDIIGADGSQIYPDRHALAHYYVINIASITVSHGSNKPPETHQKPEVYFTQDELYDPSGRPIQAAVVNLRRDVGEMQALAAAASEGKKVPKIALLDNSLLLWMTLEADAGARREIDAQLKTYLNALDSLRQGQVALGGFIDRPRNANVLALLQLAELANDDIHTENLTRRQYIGLSDSDLFRSHIPEGHRSARFILSSPLNRDFETAGHQVQFFYLNPDSGEGVVRVEIPAWVGDSPTLLDHLHAGLLQDCRTTDGFPFVLVRAHELAVINIGEREMLEAYIQQSMLRAGDFAMPSQKSITKRWTQNRRRHRL